jgi:hypothetical protein
VDRVPRSFRNESLWCWNRLCNDVAPMQENLDSHVGDDLFGVLTGAQPRLNVWVNWWLDYPTAEAAIRDLCRAYVKVNRGRG